MGTARRRPNGTPDGARGRVADGGCRSSLACCAGGRGVGPVVARCCGSETQSQRIESAAELRYTQPPTASTRRCLDRSMFCCGRSRTSLKPQTTPQEHDPLRSPFSCILLLLATIPSLIKPAHHLYATSNVLSARTRKNTRHKQIQAQKTISPKIPPPNTASSKSSCRRATARTRTRPVHPAPRPARVVDALPHVVQADALLGRGPDVVEAERAERVVLRRLLAGAAAGVERLLEVRAGAGLPCLVVFVWVLGQSMPLSDLRAPLIITVPRAGPGARRGPIWGRGRRRP